MKKVTTNGQFVKIEDATGLTNEEEIRTHFAEMFADQLPALHRLTAHLTMQIDHCRIERDWLTEMLTDLDRNDLGQRLAKQGFIPADYKERVAQAIAAIDTVLKETEGKANV